MQIWQGLGYYQRAKNLFLAKEILKKTKIKIEPNELNKKYGTLDKMKDIQDNKLNKVKNKNSSMYVILVVMYILTFLLLIILILVIKFK